MTGGAGPPAGTGSVPPHLAAKQARSSRRYAVLGAFVLLAVVNGYTWLMFEPVERAMLQTYAPHFTPAQTALLGSWQPLVYVLLFLPMTRQLLRHNGLTRSMQLGVAAEVAGLLLKVASLTDRFAGSYTSLVLLHAGQIFSAVSSPVAIGAPSQLSAEWFPPQQRTRATACGVLANNVGNAVVYLFVPLIVKHVAAATSDDGRAVGATHGIEAIVALESLLAGATVLLVLYAMPVYTEAELADDGPEARSFEMTLKGRPSLASTGGLHRQTTEDVEGLLLSMTRMSVVGSFAMTPARNFDEDAPYAYAIGWGVKPLCSESDTDSESGQTHVRVPDREQARDGEEDMLEDDISDTSRVAREMRRTSSGGSSAITRVMSGAGPLLISQSSTHSSPRQITREHSHRHSSGDVADPPDLSLRAQVLAFLRNRNALLLFVIHAWTSGAFIAWTALFDHLLMSLRLPFTDEFIGSLSFSSTVGYVIGGLLSGYIVDAYFPRAMKTVIIACCVANTGVTFLYSRSLPIDQAHRAITAAEDAIALGAALGKSVKPAKLGGTGTQLSLDPNRDTKLNRTAALLLACHAYEASFDNKTKCTSEFIASAVDSTEDDEEHAHGEKSERPRSMPLGHRLLWFPRPDSSASEISALKRFRKATRKSAVHDAVKADAELREAVPSETWLRVLSFVGGIFNGASAPLFYELIAEVTFPFVGEAVSGNLMSVGENLGALLFFQCVAAVVPDRAVNWCFVFGMVVCSAAALFPKEAYPRRAAFERAAAHRVKHQSPSAGSGRRHEAHHHESSPLMGADPSGARSEGAPTKDYGAVAEA